MSVIRSSTGSRLPHTQSCHHDPTDAARSTWASYRRRSGPNRVSARASGTSSRRCRTSTGSVGTNPSFSRNGPASGSLARTPGELLPPYSPNKYGLAGHWPPTTTRPAPRSRRCASARVSSSRPIPRRRYSGRTSTAHTTPRSDSPVSSAFGPNPARASPTGLLPASGSRARIRSSGRKYGLLNSHRSSSPGVRRGNDPAAASDGVVPHLDHGRRVGVLGVVVSDHGGVLAVGDGSDPAAARDGASTNITADPARCRVRGGFTERTGGTSPHW
ncbi:MAG: hypothetical protein U0871_08270 [Gemmataceae bacterium]